MIQANQIRINNLIYNDIGEIQPVYGVDEKSILTKVEENGWSICFNPKGIPLTEEWLLKFGFEKGVDNVYFIKTKHFYLKIFQSIGHALCSVDKYSKAIKINDDIKYVHQLQNLYFALTGKELTIKN